MPETLEINPLEKKAKVQIEIVTDYIRPAFSHSHWIAKLTTPHEKTRELF